MLRATDFLNAWQHRRWGLVAEFMPPMLYDFKSEGEAARFAKDVFEAHGLTSWDITAVTRDTASAAEIRAVATVNDSTKEMQFRMILWTIDGKIGMPGEEEATWRLAVWAPNSFFASPRGATESGPE